MIFQVKDEERKECDPRVPRDAMPCRRAGEEGKFSGKSATAGPNPPIRRSPK